MLVQISGGVNLLKEPIVQKMDRLNFMYRNNCQMEKGKLIRGRASHFGKIRCEISSQTFYLSGTFDILDSFANNPFFVDFFPKSIIQKIRACLYFYALMGAKNCKVAFKSIEQVLYA